MALINPCNAEEVFVNTGSECDDSLGATAMIISIPLDARWTKADMQNFTEYIKTKLHAAPTQRWLPIFGTAAPVRQIVDANEDDVVETMEDGSVIFIRNGMYNRTFLTDGGGMCLAKSLMGMPKKRGFIEIDANGQVLMRQFEEDLYGPVALNIGYGKMPDLANFRTSYKNKLMLSFSPAEYIKKGKVWASDSSEDLLSLRGLYDAVVYEVLAQQTAGVTQATSVTTITAVGNDGDTIDLLIDGESITGGPVEKTATESTVTLLADKIRLAINDNTATNGGYTAANVAGAITVSAPAGQGALANGIAPTKNIVGTITATGPAVFSGGVTGTVILKVGVKTECAEDDLIERFGADLVKLANFEVLKPDGTPVTISVVTLVAGNAHLTIPYVSGIYYVRGTSAATWLLSDIEGYDGAVNKTKVVVV